jgi:ribosomal-protein-alanine N-acetyltransferase
VGGQSDRVSLDEAFATFPLLETPDLVLRAPRTTDAAALFEILSDAETTRYYDDDAYTDIAQADKQLSDWAWGFEHHRTIRWAITPRGQDTLIGTCGFYEIHPWHRRCGAGYELSRAYWRRGIMMEALGAIVQFGFERLELNRIHATAMPENTASIRLLEKLGFRCEGVLRGYERWGSKGYVDLAIYARLRDDA